MTFWNVNGAYFSILCFAIINGSFLVVGFVHGVYRPIGCRPNFKYALWLI